MKPKIKKPTKAKKTVKKVIKKSKKQPLTHLGDFGGYDLFIMGTLDDAVDFTAYIMEMEEIEKLYFEMNQPKPKGFWYRLKGAISYFFTV